MIVVTSFIALPCCFPYPLIVSPQHISAYLIVSQHISAYLIVYQHISEYLIIFKPIKQYMCNIIITVTHLIYIYNILIISIWLLLHWILPIYNNLDYVIFIVQWSSKSCLLTLLITIGMWSFHLYLYIRFYL